MANTKTNGKGSISTSQPAMKRQTNLTEQTIKRSFQPLTNAKGESRLTFMGYKHSVDKNERPFLKMTFFCRGEYKGSFGVIGLLGSYRYSETNLFGRFLNTVGFIEPQPVDSTIEDDDEFGNQKEDVDLDTAIYEFLNQLKGKVFKGLLEIQEGRSLYRLNVDSLNYYIDKKGNQVIDFEPHQAPEPSELENLHYDSMTTED